MPIILLVIGIVLVVYNYIAIKKGTVSFEIQDHEERRKKDSSFENVLEKSKDELNDYKIELGMFRRNVAESFTEVQEEILEIKKYLNIVKNDKNLYDYNDEEKNSIMIDDNIDNKIDEDIISEINFNHRKDVRNLSVNKKKSDIKKVTDSIKTESIKKLLDQGLSEEEVCRRLSISKGEVLLVKDLFKN